MDACLELLLPALRIVPSLERKVFLWGGEEHPQDPDTYFYGPLVEIKLIDVPKQILSLLPGRMRQMQWQYAAIHGQGLDRIEDGSDFALEDFIRSQLLPDEPWAIVFAWQCDRIDVIFEAASADEVRAKLHAQLHRSSTERGFLAFHEVSR